MDLGPDNPARTRPVRQPSVVDAVVPMVMLALLIAASLALFGLDALDGPIQVALIFCVLIAALIGMRNGHTWVDVERAARTAFTSITSAVLILLAVGALIGVWNLSGTIPTLVYYGIQVLSPSWYYAATEFGLIARLVDPLIRLEFARRGLAPTNLSRLAADSATVTSPLVPWNSCGAFMGAVLGVPTLSYLPHAVFNYASPALSVLYGVTGFKVEKVTPAGSPSEP